MFLGQAPKNMPRMSLLRGTPNFQIFSKLKKSKILNCDFWSGKCSKWPNLDPGGIKNTFWVEKKFFQIFRFLDLKNFKKFWKICHFFQFSISKFLNFLSFFANFYYLSPLLTHLEVSWSLQNVSKFFALDVGAFWNRPKSHEKKEKKFWFLTFPLIFMKNFTSLTPITFCRQSFLSLITTPKKSKENGVLSKNSFLRENWSPRSQIG